MVINVVLYDEKSVVSVAEKAVGYLSKRELYRTTRDTIWVNGLYLKFSPNLIVINIFNSYIFTQEMIFDFLYHIFCGEEIFVSEQKAGSKYIEKIVCRQDFISFFMSKGV